MKRIAYAAFLWAFIATPALALRVTNLDTVAHTVEFSGTGKPERHVVQPNATENFTGATQGFISLVAPQKEDAAPASGKRKSRTKTKEKSEGVVHADGLLSGIIGNGRSEGIPADPANNYVIWSGGRIALQGRSNRLERR